MPTYLYRCLTCDERLEIVQAFTDDTLSRAGCPRCGSVQPVRKVFTPVGVTFKGSGFYKTDSRGSASRSSASGDKSESSSESHGHSHANGHSHSHDHAPATSSTSTSTSTPTSTPSSSSGD